MKITMITRDGNDVPAALLDDGRLVDLRVASDAGLVGCPNIKDVMQIIDLDGPAFAAVRAFVDKLEGSDRQLSDQLSSLNAFVADAVYAQILRPQIIISCGMAYKAHLAEMDVSSTAGPSTPMGFLKSQSALNAHKKPIVLPPHEPDMVDWECEFSCVIGRTFHNVTADEVMAHVAGYTMLNDLGSRMSAAKFVDGLNGKFGGQEFMEAFTRNALEKQYPTFCPIGPVIHTADTFGDPMDVNIETRVNGEVMQSANTRDLFFTLAQTLAYYSRWYRFQPGDVVTTGSPPGVGMGRNPPRFLRPGDILETGADRIGVMVNPVVAG